MKDPYQPITSEEMRALDEAASRKFGISPLILMENAGRGAANLIEYRFPVSQNIAIYCGKGNNGGDGFVIARHLWNFGKEVSVILLADPKDLKGDAKTNFEILKKMKIPVTDLEFPKKAELLVDAILGIGISGELDGDIRKAVEGMNASGKHIFAVDIPTGLNSDSGKIQGAAVRASMTGTMGAVKKGMLIGEGPECCGEICVVDIGLPRLDTPRGF